MNRRSWLLALASLILAICIGLSLSLASRATAPLHPIMTVTGLPTPEESIGAALSPIRFDDPTAPTDLVASEPTPLAQSAPNYHPREEIALANPSNYGDRYLTDAFGRPVQNNFIAVLHETVGSARSAINLFQTYHPRDADQVSYHTLITRDGTIIYIVPPEKRAYGAGNSVFEGLNGPEAVTTNPDLPPSVNNFAYHISLETPSDGRGSRRSHSGYTQAQYESLAWLLARTIIPTSRITTHRRVDRSGSRLDPRSFDFQLLSALLNRYPSRAGLPG